MADARDKWNLGRLAMGLLAVTVFTGIALIPFYHPDRALDSLEAMAGGIPWLWWLRGIHGYAAHALVIVSILHVVEVLRRRAEGRIGPGAWWRSVFVVPVLMGAMLGGFVLRGDVEASEALSVWQGMLNSLGGAGRLMSDFLLGASGSPDLSIVAAHHASTFTLLLWALCADHGGIPWPDVRSMVLGAFIGMVPAALIPLPLGPAIATPGELALAPWYLLGVQGALLDIPVASVWIGAAVVMLSMGLIRHARGAGRGVLIAVLGASVAAWVAWSVRILLVARPF
ncbi:MAG: hypothetical protein GXP54_12445 [Deltaproteobacteria bacterium]|nr:hypothetical protein [Deltaproteobacteria bacterium]